MTFTLSPPAPIASPGPNGVQDNELENVLSEPQWVSDKCETWWGEPFSLEEWHTADDEEQSDYRAKNGWKGRDYLHDRAAPVRIVEYFVRYGNGDGVEGLARGGISTSLTGIVHFTERAESHQGLCHGGSMCSVMDDIIGWCAMFVTGSCHPWSGFTVQVNTALRRPIPVGTFLLARASIVDIERRKVKIQAALVDPSGDDEIVHAEGEGLVVMNKGVLPC